MVLFERHGDEIARVPCPHDANIPINQSFTLRPAIPLQGAVGMLVPISNVLHRSRHAPPCRPPIVAGTLRRAVRQGSRKRPTSSFHFTLPVPFSRRRVPCPRDAKVPIKQSFAPRPVIPLQRAVGMRVDAPGTVIPSGSTPRAFPPRPHHPHIPHLSPPIRTGYNPG